MPRNVRGIDRTADRVREDQCIPVYGNIFVLRQEVSHGDVRGLGHRHLIFGCHTFRRLINNLFPCAAIDAAPLLPDRGLCPIPSLPATIRPLGGGYLRRFRPSSPQIASSCSWSGAVGITVGVKATS